MIKMRATLSLAAAVLTLGACSAGDDPQDQALEALERASQAAGLESEMAGLIEGLPAEPSAEQTAELETELERLDSDAEELLASADTGEEFDEQIADSVEQTRAAGTDLATAVERPGSAGQAKNKAVGKLKEANNTLGGAVEQIGEELEEDGEVPAEAAEELEQTLDQVEEAEQAVATVATDPCKELASELSFPLEGPGSIEASEDGDLCIGVQSDFVCALTEEAAAESGVGPCEEVVGQQDSGTTGSQESAQDEPARCPPGQFFTVGSSGNLAGGGCVEGAPGEFPEGGEIPPEAPCLKDPNLDCDPPG